MLTIIGCGNLNRRDDGVGVIVARQLRDFVVTRGFADVSVFDAGTAGMDVMFQARGARKLVLIDASRTGAEPGALYRVPGAELERDYDPGFSLHDFRWDHALHAGRRIFGSSFPTDITVFLIEASDLSFGLGLSDPVRHGAERLVVDIEKIINRYATSTVC
jgi:hydrogenase maturation protease